MVPVSPVDQNKQKLKTPKHKSKPFWIADKCFTTADKLCEIVFFLLLVCFLTRIAVLYYKCIKTAVI